MSWSLRAILFDLDDTLLENDMTTFAAAYFESFGRRLAPLGSPEKMIAALRATIEAVLQHTDPAVTNEERFWLELARHTGLPLSALRPHLDRFYAEDFSRLRHLTRRRPEAREVVAQARARGLKVVLATNPMFPAAAIAQRIVWAGLHDQDFTRITTLDNSHACKPNPAYFLEVLSAIDAQPEETLIVGDDWRLDIAPAIALGMKTYWMKDALESPPDASMPDAMGTWQDFLKWWGS